MINTYFQTKKKMMTLKLAEATGYPCRLYKSAGKNLKNYKIYGNSIQDGTPTIETPVLVQSLGQNGSFDVTTSGKNILYKENVSALTYGYIIPEISKNRLKVGSYYTLYSPNWVSLVTGKTFIIRYTNTNNVFAYVGTWTSRGFTFQYTQAMKDANNLQLYVSGVTANQFNQAKFQIAEVQSSTDFDSEYEDYIEPIINTINLTGHEPLRKIGDYTDYIDYESKKIYRNTRKVDISKENYTSYAGNYYINISSPNYYSKINMLAFCDHLQYGGTKTSAASAMEDGYFYLFLNTSQPNIYRIMMNANTYNQVIALDNCNIYYQLANQQEEDFESISIQTIKNTCIITANDEELEANNIYAKYLSK